MALSVTTQSFEVENLIGMRASQVLLRAEALVPGAGREAIEPLMSDASLFIDTVELQADRVVLDGTVSCQAVYRQGDETALRALTAQASLNHVLEIPGAEAGMFSRTSGAVEHVEARYENGHMIFLVTCVLRAQALRLSPAECVTSVAGAEGLETAYRRIRSVKLAAESTETALLRETAPLPAALDARATLMDWATVEIEDVAPDLGGVRVRGRALVETLVSSGAEGRPAAVMRVTMPFSQLVELPEWLSGGASAEADVRGVRTRIDMDANGEAPQLTAEAELRVRVMANTADEPEALEDIYATQGNALDVREQAISLCANVLNASTVEQVRGMVPIGVGADGAPAQAGAVIAVQARPVIGEWQSTGDTGRIEGILEVEALYMDAAANRPASARAELPFSVNVPIALDETSIIRLQTLSVEASAVMGDRLDLRAQLAVRCETRRRETIRVISEVSEGAPIERTPGIVICWPGEDDDAWHIGKRYAIPAERVAEAAPGQPLVLEM